MKKIAKIISIILLAICISIFCSCEKSESSENTETVTIVDMVGDTVEVPKNPSKVACVSRTTYDLMIGFGLGDKIDGAYKGLLKNPWVNFIYPESKNHFVYGYKDSYETFLSRGVDLVFAPEQYIAKDLRDHGVNAITVSLYGEPTFDNYVTYFPELLCKLWDTPDVRKKADKWNNDVQKAISDITSELAKHDIKQKSVFYVRGDKDKGVNHTDNKAAFSEYAYRILGCDFIGAHWVNTPQPAVEEVINSNPDLFVCGGIFQHKNLKSLQEEPYSQLDAVKNNHIYTIPVGFTNFEQLSAMTPIFFYDQANKIYPEYFNYDIASMVKNTVKEYFGTELSDTHVEYILKALGPDGTSL